MPSLPEQLARPTSRLSAASSPVAGDATHAADLRVPAAAAGDGVAAIVWSRRPAAAMVGDAAFARQWDALNAARGDVPCLAAHVVAAALAELGSGAECLLLGHRTDRLVAAFVLTPGGRLQWQTFQPSQLPLGAWVAGSSFALEDLGRSLLQASALPVALMLSITRVDPLIAVRKPDRPDDRHTDYIDTAWIDVDGTPEAYWAARGKNLRQNMRKQRNKLSAEGLVPLSRRLTAVADMASAVERYGRLESAGWKGGGGSAVQADNAQGRFYRRLLEGAAERGEAVVYELLFDDRTVAVNLCLQRNGTLVILKTAYDESIKVYSPAFLLHQDMVDEWFAADRDVRRVEYFGQVMDWHTKWTANRRALHHLTLYRYSWVKSASDAWRERRIGKLARSA